MEEEGGVMKPKRVVPISRRYTPFSIWSIELLVKTTFNAVVKGVNLRNNVKTFVICMIIAYICREKLTELHYVTTFYS